MPRPSSVRIVKRLTSAGHNVEPEAVTLLAATADPDSAVATLLEAIDESRMTVTAEDVRFHLESALDLGNDTRSNSGNDTRSDLSRNRDENPSVSGGDTPSPAPGTESKSPPETKGVTGRQGPSDRPLDRSAAAESVGVGSPTNPPKASTSSRERPPTEPEITGDVTGRSTGTGEYEDFVSVFRDRYERLASLLRGRVKHRPTDALEAMPGGADAALVGMVSDVRSTRNGHRLIELEDTNGTFPALFMNDRELFEVADELLLDEVIAVSGSLSSDGGILFADEVHFPDVPRTYQPSTADRHVRAALISDLHVGSEEFLAGAFEDFADWLHTPDAAAVEYLLIAGDMVEGVGVYPGQDEELAVVDIYEQYERFAEHLKAVPGDIEIVMVPGNHDAVRLAEPQPGFEPELRKIMRAHDATIAGNPSTVTIEGVSVLLYHGVSLDEVIAELPLESVSYEHPHEAMAHLLKKRHLAPTFGGKNRIAPEKRDYLVIEDVPDLVHAGHVHKLGVGAYRQVRLVNSGCFQDQTAYQRSVNIDPDTGTAPIVDLDTLEVTVRKFG